MGKQYICADIHGFYNRYLKLLEEIRFSEDDTMYIIGDVIDRGPQSMPLILDIMKRKNMVFLLGNHELMMYDNLTSTGRPDIWMYDCNGGAVTFFEYLALEGNQRKSIFEFIKDAWIQVIIEVEGEKYWLSHSSIMPPEKYGERNIRFSDPDVEYYDVFRTVWYSPLRETEYEDPSSYRTGQYTHLTGHVPVQRAQATKPPYTISPGIIDIDGGCAISANARSWGKPDIGGLYCMCLEKDEQGLHKEWFITE